jgi:hypothetical protein
LDEEDDVIRVDVVVVGTVCVPTPIIVRPSSPSPCLKVEVTAVCVVLEKEAAPRAMLYPC